MTNPFSLIKYAGLGAGMMYFFDPVTGNRRRALIKDQCNHLFTISNSQASGVYRDARNRLQGVKAEIRSIVEPSEEGFVERLRDGTTEAVKTLAWQGQFWSPTAKAAAGLAGVCVAVSLFNKRGLAALALGAMGLTYCAREMSVSNSRQGSKNTEEDFEPKNLESSVRTGQMATHDL